MKIALLCLAACAEGSEPPQIESPPSPTASTASIWIEPEDLVTNIGATSLRVGVLGRTEDEARSVAAVLAPALHLDTWNGTAAEAAVAGAATIATPTQVADGYEATVTFVPTQPLTDGWYRLAVQRAPVAVAPRGLATRARVIDGGLASVFRVGSQPIVRSIQHCSDGTYVEYSEAVREPSSSELVGKHHDPAFRRRVPLAVASRPLVGVTGISAARDALAFDSQRAVTLGDCTLTPR